MSRVDENECFGVFEHSTFNVVRAVVREAVQKNIIPAITIAKRRAVRIGRSAIEHEASSRA
jgi:hypothetical protein